MPFYGGMNPYASPSLFKTSLCKHFEQQGKCNIGNKCNYAHGKHELRNKDDVSQIDHSFLQPIPVDIQLKMMHIPYSNYKTQRCKFFDESGSCKFGQNCSYAHGDFDLRNPYDTIPILPPTQSMSSAYMQPSGFQMFQTPQQETVDQKPVLQQQQQPDVKLIVNSTNDQEIFNIKNMLTDAYRLIEVGQEGQATEILNELLLQSKIAFQYPAWFQEKQTDPNTIAAASN